MSDELREQLAAQEHEQWAGWMRYLFSRGTFNDYDGTWAIPRWAVERWKRQVETAYADLPEDEKDCDREEADRVLAIVGAELAAVNAALEDKHRAWIAVERQLAAARVVVEAAQIAAVGLMADDELIAAVEAYDATRRAL